MSLLPAFGGKDETPNKRKKVVCDGEKCMLKDMTEGRYEYGNGAGMLSPRAKTFLKAVTPSIVQRGIEGAFNSPRGQTVASAALAIKDTPRKIYNAARAAPGAIGYRWKASTQAVRRLGHSVANLMLIPKEPLRLKLQRGIADEIYGTKPTRPMPVFSDISKHIYERMFPVGPGESFARHVIVFKVYGYSFLSHHAVEVMEGDTGHHYVVQWSMGSEANMTDEEKKQKDARIHAAMNNHAELKALFEEGTVMVQDWAEFKSGWDKACDGNANFFYRVYERGYVSDEIVARLKAFMGCATLKDCEPLKKTFVRFPGEEGEFSYSLTNNNCEHFANYICCGVHASKQTQVMQELMLYQRRVLKRPCNFITKAPDERFVPPAGRPWNYVATPDDMARAANAILEERKPNAETFKSEQIVSPYDAEEDTGTSVAGESVADMNDVDEDEATAAIGAHLAYMGVSH